MREKRRPSETASACASVVLPTPGHVLDQQVAAGQQAGDAVLDLGRLPTMIVLIWLTSSDSCVRRVVMAHRPRTCTPHRFAEPAQIEPMTTAFYSHPDCRGHDMGRGHPECPARLDAIEDHLLATGLDVALERREAPLVADADLGLAHSSGYVAELARRARARRPTPAGRCAVDPDTRRRPDTLAGRAARRRRRGGGDRRGARRRRSRTRSARCARPATTRRATRRWASASSTTSPIAARHALDVRGLERVAIVDFDVHHGNGTEDIIAGDERVLMVEHLPAPALSVQRRRADGRQHGQRAGAAVHARARRCAS